MVSTMAGISGKIKGTNFVAAIMARPVLPSPEHRPWPISVT